MKRIYESIIRDHFENKHEMLFITGASQVGKTTTVREALWDGHYLNWDTQEDRLTIIQGQNKLEETLSATPGQMIVFDALQKYRDWKQFIKEFHEHHQSSQCEILVTGNSRVDTHFIGEENLLGRFFHLQMFPISVGELVRSWYPGTPISIPKHPEQSAWESLLRFGGFPEPLLKANTRFHRKWIRDHKNRLFNEDIRALGKAYDLSKIELLSELITINAATSLNHSIYSRMIRASVESIQRWIDALEQLSFCFTIRPWTKNISRAIIKEPMIYLTDWSNVSEEEKRNENFVGCSLLKAVTLWNEIGAGDFGLNYIRTKDNRGVDFLVTRDSKPWLLVVVKTSDTSLSPQLEHFQNLTGASHALQVVIDLPFREVDCFSFKVPTVVPAQTFLSQLV